MIKRFFPLLCLTLLCVSGCQGTSIDHSFASSLHSSEMDEDRSVFNLSFTKATQVLNAISGTLTIEKDIATQNKDIKNYKIFWGINDEKLSNYTQIATVSAAATIASYTMKDGQAIPQEANSIIVEGTSRAGVVLKTKVFDVKKMKEASTLLYEFQVISDQQVTAKNGNFYQKSIRAYNDIQTQSPQSEFIIANGDIVDAGRADYYEAYQESAQASFGDKSSTIYYALGNHEYIPTSNLDYEKYTDLAYQYLPIADKNGGKPYYQFEKHGFSYIVLGSIAMPGSLAGNTQCSMTLGETQLAWFETEMQRASQSNKPIFVFMHTPLKDTVSGSRTELGQTWYGLVEEEDKAMKTILAQYEKAFVFSSHTHWCFESEYPYLLNEQGPSYFNTAAVSYLWAGHNAGYIYDGTYDTTKGSQGLFVEVYEDYVLIKGRNFADRQGVSSWYSNYQVILPY